MEPTESNWDFVEEKAIRDDGTLLFPERLTHEFLAQARRTMGSYLFANQYQNEVIPEGEKKFKPQWIRLFTHLPERLLTFAFIDPAIGQEKIHDYTALVVVSVDMERNWYVRHASRQRITPSQIIEMCFDVNARWSPSVIGIEAVAFQRALAIFAAEEARKRGINLPVHPVTRSSDKSKEMRILSLVPRFEWGSLYLAGNQHDLELELGQFPRGQHDDILDALASIADIVHYPAPLRKRNEAPAPNSPHYEEWYRRNLYRRAGSQESDLR
jgi:predicted phage terminase large subunit-like protein